jgi:hypothetical protein
MLATREGLVREALRPVEAEERTVQAVAALLDCPVFKSFRRHDIQREEAREAMKAMLVCWLTGPRNGR